jgi:hypothetical protein
MDKAQFTVDVKNMTEVGYRVEKTTIQIDTAAVSDGVDVQNITPVIIDDPTSSFPDGGMRAWSVVAASFLVVFPTFGNSDFERGD